MLSPQTKRRMSKLSAQLFETAVRGASPDCVLLLEEDLLKVAEACDLVVVLMQAAEARANPKTQKTPGE